MFKTPEMPWFVMETPCFPCAWRVTSTYYRTDNSDLHFFETEAEAKDEAQRRNEAHQRVRWQYEAAGLSVTPSPTS